jgi:hypothetical protein
VPVLEDSAAGINPAVAHPTHRRQPIERGNTVTKLLNRRWALALIIASMFGTAGATVSTASADAFFKPDICGDFCKL